MSDDKIGKQLQTWVTKSHLPNVEELELADLRGYLLHPQTPEKVAEWLPEQVWGDEIME